MVWWRLGAVYALHLSKTLAHARLSPKQGTTHQDRGTTGCGYTADPWANNAFISGVVFTSERATVQDIPIGMKVFLVWQIKAQWDNNPKQDVPCAPTTSDSLYIEVTTATAQTWRKKLSLLRKDTMETWTLGYFWIPCYLQ